MALASVEVIRIMRRRDFDSARSELHLDQLRIRNNWNAALAEGMKSKLANDLLVPEAEGILSTEEVQYIPPKRDIGISTLRDCLKVDRQ